MRLGKSGAGHGAEQPLRNGGPIVADTAWHTGKDSESNRAGSTSDTTSWRTDHPDRDDYRPDTHQCNVRAERRVGAREPRTRVITESDVYPGRHAARAPNFRPRLLHIFPVVCAQIRFLWRAACGFRQLEGTRRSGKPRIGKPICGGKYSSEEGRSPRSPAGAFHLPNDARLAASSAVHRQ